METRSRTELRIMRAPPRREQGVEKGEKTEMQRSRLMNTEKEPHRSLSRSERRIALQQDVDKLRKNLRHEENIHRALERAFTRPLGALPRLPPYLSSNTLELLAEVAVLEEEVVRLEEQVVNFWQGLYQEAIYISSFKKTENVKKNDEIKPHATIDNSETSFIRNSSNQLANGKQRPKKPSSFSCFLEDQCGKENRLNVNSTRNNKQSQLKKVPRERMPKFLENTKAQPECSVNGKERVEERIFSNSDEALLEEVSGPNRLSEDILKCLLSIFSQMSSPKNVSRGLEMSPSVSDSCKSSEDIYFGDPYGTCLQFGRRDIGPYKHFCAVEARAIDPNNVASSFHKRRLKILLRKLTSVDLSVLTHQKKLAFWINIYNSCMMHAFLEQGIPTSPQMVATLMTKAMINVGGRLLSAMTIEHFILRLPYQSEYSNPKGSRSDEMRTRAIYGLEWPEPFVTFALSCGSWSSPAVRVYTASQVKNELEEAKRDYLQAAVGISATNKLAIPKLLDWYLLDFAKDVESLMEWICLQLQNEARSDAVKCLEMVRRNQVPQPIEVLPYEFSFRYLFAS